MLALAALENWYITGLDVQSTYLYGKLDKEIYMEQPEGFAVPGQEHKVLRLWRALYGLKQAGLAWWHTLDESLKELGFERLKSEAGIFFYKKKGTNIVIGIIYVDDALFCSPNKAVVDAITAQFMHKWECRDLGEPNEFLRMRITHKGCAVETRASLGVYPHIRACLARSYGVQVPMHTGGTLAHSGLPVRCAYISPTELQPSIRVSSSFSHPQQCLRAQYPPSLHPRYSAQPPTLLTRTSSPTCRHMRSVAPCEGPTSVHSLYLSLCALQSLGTASGCLCLLALLSTATCTLHAHSCIC